MILSANALVMVTRNYESSMNQFFIQRNVYKNVENQTTSIAIISVLRSVQFKIAHKK